MVEGSSPEEDPVPIPLIVQKMETLKARMEDLELSELARRFEKIDTQEQVFKERYLDFYMSVIVYPLSTL